MQDTLLQLLIGEFDNFQQVWLQHTDTDLHRVYTDCPHRLIHTVIVPLQHEGSGFDALLNATYYTDRNPLQRIGHWIYGLKGHTLTVFEAERFGIQSIPIETIQWQQKEDGWHGHSPKGQWQLSSKGLKIRHQDPQSLFFNAAEAYQMLRCRFFTGWIETPNDNAPNGIYRYPGLRLHDQGDKVQLRHADGTLGKYTVELTQLVFGHTIPIMKLAVYELDSEAVEFNSYAAAYTWTNPEAQRIGINLRYITTGWTLEAAGLVASKINSKEG